MCAPEIQLVAALKALYDSSSLQGQSAIQEHFVELEEQVLDAWTKLFNQYNPKGGNVPRLVRDALFDLGLVTLALETLELEFGRFTVRDEIHLVCWRVIENSVARFNIDDPTEAETSDRAAQMGVIEAAVREAYRERTRAQIIIKTPLTTMGLCDHLVPQILQAGVGPACSRIIKRGREKSSVLCVEVALGVFKNLAMNLVAKDALIQEGLLPLCEEMLHQGFKPDSDEADLRLGLFACSIICRLVGKDEEGTRGAKAIEENRENIFPKLLWHLSSVLKAGPEENFLGSRYNPANIMLDAALLAKSDLNKPFMADFVPQCLISLQERSDMNRRLGMFAVETLSQLIFEKQCRPAFEKDKVQLIDILEKKVIAQDQNYPPNIIKTAKVLVGSIHKLGSDPAQVEKNIITRVDATPENEAHVMISYQWEHQSLALRLATDLKERQGLKVWFDMWNMGSNINDSMAEAIENSKMVIVLVSPLYKESGNCRKECELADELSKPIVFAKVEEGYTPNGWLRLIMGKALWLSMHDEPSMDASLPTLLQRVHGCGNSSSNAQVVSATASSSSSASHSAEVKTLVEEMKRDYEAKLDNMNSKLDQVLSMAKKKRWW